jgi:threonine dehydrogenase-like Zn-dependent dehydrogenase
MRAVQFDVTIAGYLLARSLGRLSESAIHGLLSGVRLRELPEPDILGPEWVRLEVLGAGICGTDLGNLDFSASPALEPFGSFPAVPGHEVLARVESVGPGVTRVKPGDRVAVDPMLSCGVRGWPVGTHCRSCNEGRHSTCEMAGERGRIRIAEDRELSAGLTIGYHRDLPGGWGEKMIAHEAQLFPLDDRISHRAGVLIEPLSVGVHAALNAPPREGEEVLVIGSGPIAFAAIWGLRSLGFRGTIIAQVKRASDAAHALSVGATETVTPGAEAREALVGSGAIPYRPIIGKEIFSKGGFPYIVDCVGTHESLMQALYFAAPRGRVIMLGCAAELRKVDLTLLWARELEVRGFIGYGMERWRGEDRHTFEVTETLLLEGAPPVDGLVTHVFPLKEYRFALSAAAPRRRSEAVNVVLTPTEAGLV